jgi:DNA-directed RNA polymerase subunit F
MDILKWWPGALLMKGIATITGDQSMHKKIDASSWWKQRQSISKQVMQKEKELVQKVKDIDYETKRHQIKELAYEKEKDLQKHIKKLQSYADSLGEKKIKEIVDDIKMNSNAFVKKLDPSIKSTQKKVNTTAQKSTSEKTVPTKKSNNKTTAKSKK